MTSLLKQFPPEADFDTIAILKILGDARDALAELRGVDGNRASAQAENRAEQLLHQHPIL